MAPTGPPLVTCLSSLVGDGEAVIQLNLAAYWEVVCTLGFSRLLMMGRLLSSPNRTGYLYEHVLLDWDEWTDAETEVMKPGILLLTGTAGEGRLDRCRT